MPAGYAYVSVLEAKFNIPEVPIYYFSINLSEADMDLNFKFQRNEEAQLKKLFNRQHRKQNRKKIVEEMIAVRKGDRTTRIEHKKYRNLKEKERANPNKAIAGKTASGALVSAETDKKVKKRKKKNSLVSRAGYAVKKKIYTAEWIGLYVYFALTDLTAALKAKKLLCCAAVLSVMFAVTVFFAYNRFICYEITFNGYKFGTVKNISVLNTAFENTTAKFSEWYHNDTVFFEQTISVKRIVLTNQKNLLSTEDCEKLLFESNVPVYAKGAVILIEGVEAVNAVSAEEAQKIIEGIQLNSLNETASGEEIIEEVLIDSNITQEITIKEKNVELASVKSTADAITYMMALGQNTSPDQLAGGSMLPHPQNEENGQPKDIFVNESGNNGIMTALNFRKEDFSIGEKTSKPALEWTSKKKIKYTKELQYKTVYKKDASLYLGYEKVVTKGTAGSAEVEAVVTYVNGKESSRTILKENIITEPVSEVVARGSKVIPPSASSGKYIIPVTGRVSSFNNRRTGSHTNFRAIDIACDTGTAVFACDNGTVIETGVDSSYGKYIVIQHQGGFTTMYAHLDAHVAKLGAVVSQGDIIGKSGNTGDSTGPHLHLEIRYKNVRQDLRSYFPDVKEGMTVKAGQ